MSKQKCHKCGAPVFYDLTIKSWRCMSCNWRDRK